MVDTTRRSFITGIAGLFASLMVPSTSEAAGKNPTPPQPGTTSGIDKLVQLYMPLCNLLEKNTPFCYKDEGHPTIGCGVHFKDFFKKTPALKEYPAFKIVPKEKAVLIPDEKRLAQIATADWKKPQTKSLFPEVERVEQVKLKDLSFQNCETELPTSKTETWDKALFWMPNKTLKDVNLCAAKFFVRRAAEIHKDLFLLPPSVRLVIVDLLYNVGNSGYGSSKKFPNFKAAVRARNFDSMKKECTTKNNTRRNTVRQWLIESARLANNGLSEERVKQTLRRGVSFKMSPRLEKNLWCEVDKSAKENCAWKRAEIAKQKARQAQKC